MYANSTPVSQPIYNPPIQQQQHHHQQQQQQPLTSFGFGNGSNNMDALTSMTGGMSLNTVPSSQAPVKQTSAFDDLLSSSWSSSKPASVKPDTGFSIGGSNVQQQPQQKPMANNNVWSDFGTSSKPASQSKGNNLEDDVFGNVWK